MNTDTALQIISRFLSPRVYHWRQSKLDSEDQIVNFRFVNTCAACDETTFGARFCAGCRESQKTERASWARRHMRCVHCFGHFDYRSYRCDDRCEGDERFGGDEGEYERRQEKAEKLARWRKANGWQAAGGGYTTSETADEW